VQQKYFTEIYYCKQYVQVRNVLLNLLMYYTFYGINVYRDLVPIYSKHLDSLHYKHKKVTAVYHENHMKHTCTLCGEKYGVS